MPVSRNQLLLDGRVEINVNLALGYLQVPTIEDKWFLYVLNDTLCPFSCLTLAFLT